MWLFDYTDRNQIIVLVLLPQAIYQLRSLDVILFLPLGKTYSWGLSDYFAKGQKLMSMSKQLFYSFFKKAWKASFIENNIEAT